MSDSNHAAPVTVAPIVGRAKSIVIQGLRGGAWRDIEVMCDCDYSRTVYARRVMEYLRGDCAQMTAIHASFRIIARETIDREFTPNAGAVPRSDSYVGTSPLLAVSESGDK